MFGNPLCSVFTPSLFVDLWWSIRLLWHKWNGCHCWGMFHSAVLADKGLLLAFHKSLQALFPRALIGWFTCASVFLCSIISLYVCSVFYSKSPWEARAFALGLVWKISWLVLMFCCLLGTRRADPRVFLFFVWVCVTLLRNSACPPPLCSKDIFQDWCMESRQLK